MSSVCRAPVQTLTLVVELERVAAKKVIQRDMSLGNIVIRRPHKGRARGMLIDMDKACILNDRGQDDSGDLTVGA